MAFGIGGGEPVAQTHISFTAPQSLTSASVHVVVDRPIVHVDHPRTVWEWRFTIRPTAEAGAPYVAVLYDTADAFDSFYVWNESGYGSPPEMQHTSWTAPRYGMLGAIAQSPAAWARF